MFVLFPWTGGKRKRRQNDDGNSRVRGCAHGVLPPFGCCRKSSHFPHCRQRHLGAEVEKLDAFRYFFAVCPGSSGWRSRSWNHSEAVVYDIGLKKSDRAVEPENATRTTLGA